MDPYQSLLGSAFEYEPDHVSSELHRQHNTRGLSGGSHEHHREKHYKVYPGETWEGHAGHGQAFSHQRHRALDQPELPRGYPDYDPTVPHVGPTAMPYHPMLPPQHFGAHGGAYGGAHMSHHMPHGNPQNPHEQYERVVGEYQDVPRFIGERVLEQPPIQRPQVMLEKTVEVPTVVVKERVKNVPKTQFVERVIEMPVVSYEEHVKEVPVKKQVKRKVEVPYERLEEKIIYVPKIEYQERIIEVPKVEYVEKIEYDDRIEYREVPFDTYVECPEIEYKYVNVPYDVPEPYFQEVPEYRYAEVPEVQIQEVDRHERVPVPEPQYQPQMQPMPMPPMQPQFQPQMQPMPMPMPQQYAPAQPYVPAPGMQMPMGGMPMPTSPLGPGAMMAPGGSAGPSLWQKAR